MIRGEQTAETNCHQKRKSLHVTLQGKKRMSHYSTVIFPRFLSPWLISSCLSMYPLWEGLKSEVKTQVKETRMQFNLFASRVTLSPYPGVSCASSVTVSSSVFVFSFVEGSIFNA